MKLSKNSFKIALLLVIGMSLTQFTFGQSFSEAQYKKDMENFWIDYAKLLRKLNGAPTDQGVIDVINDAKANFIPKKKKLMVKYHGWTKNKTRKELEAMEDWMEKNPHEQECEKLEEDPQILKRSTKNPTLAKAVKEFRLAMIQTN